MPLDLFDDSRARIETAAEKHAQFVIETERFIYHYVKGMIKGFDTKGAFAIQLHKPSKSEIRGRPRVLAGEIVESLRSALDYAVFALSLRNNPSMNRKHPKFVIADDKDAFVKQAKGALKHLADRELNYLEDLQPFSTNNPTLSLIRDAANKVKHRSLLKIVDKTPLELAFAEIEKKEEYEGWWCYPQEKGTALFAHGEIQVVILDRYEAKALLRDMIQSVCLVVGGFDHYMTTGSFPKVIPN